MAASSLRRCEVALIYSRAGRAAAALVRAERPDVWQQLVDAEYAAAGLERRPPGAPRMGRKESAEPRKNPLTGGAERVTVSS